MPAPVTLARRVLPDTTAPKGIADMSRDELIAALTTLAQSRGLSAPPPAFELSVSNGGINPETGKPKAIGITINIDGKRSWIKARLLRELLDHADECEAFLAKHKDNAALWK